jgi:hypothetical protein
MPRILTKIRIDEISAVDCGAGEGCKVSLYKRDRAGNRLFGYDPLELRRYDVGKVDYRGQRGRHLYRIEGLTRAEAKHWLMHDAHGRTLLRESGTDIDTLADHLVEASNKHAVEKREDKMDSVDHTIKALKAMSEAEFVTITTKMARGVYPNMTGPQAFAKLFTDDSDEGRGVRAAHRIVQRNAKGSRSTGDEDEPPRRRRIAPGDPGESGTYWDGEGYRGGGLDPDEAGRSSRRIMDDAIEDEDDALDELEDLAIEERKRNPSLTKERAFAKAFLANPQLAARERASAMRKIGMR